METTAQGLFDQAVLFLARQKKKSAVRDQCRYRKSDGTKCAVGCLFQRGEYKKEMEGKCVEQLKDGGLLPDRLLPHLPLLEDLQHAHDMGITANMVTSLLMQTASRFGLDNKAVFTFTEWKNEEGMITKTTFEKAPESVEPVGS